MLPSSQSDTGTRSKKGPSLRALRGSGDGLRSIHLPPVPSRVKLIGGDRTCTSTPPPQRRSTSEPTGWSGKVGGGLKTNSREVPATCEVFRKDPRTFVSIQRTTKANHFDPGSREPFITLQLMRSPTKRESPKKHPTTPIFQRRDMFPADRQTSPGAQKNPEFQSRLSVMDIDEGLGVRMADPWLAKQGSCSGWGARDFRRTGELDICVLFHGKALCKHHGNSWSPLLSGLSGWKEDQDVSCASLS